MANSPRLRGQIAVWSMRATQPLRADTVGLDMIFLLALDSITGETTVSIALVITAVIGLGGFVIGLAVSRALHGEELKRHDTEIKKIKEMLEASPPAMNAEEIKELKAWRAEAARQLHESEIHRAVLEERSAASTASGARPKTGPRKKVDPT